MNSATSTDGAPTFRPWHFFVILTLLAATVAVLTAKRTTPEHLILLSVVCFAAGGATLAVYRTLLPLAGRDHLLRGETLSHRARAEMEREKQLVLRSIKEAEFDRAMGKLAEGDFVDVSTRLRARALRLMQQLDANEAAPRARIEEELAARLREPAASGRAAKSPPAPRRQAEAAVMDTPDTSDATDASARNRSAVCGNCGAANDEDARFCKSCGTRLAADHA
jgi:ribosomal protein L40E